jgi:predicted RNase H-like HicB family nuclease
MAKDAIRCYLESAQRHGEPIPTDFVPQKQVEQIKVAV